MALTDDRTDPDLGRGPGGVGLNKKYLVLPEEERQKGFVRGYRDTYVHRKCGGVTTMARPIAETYARDPAFYTSTYCATCMSHFPVAEFRWDYTNENVGS